MSHRIVIYFDFSNLSSTPSEMIFLTVINYLAGMEINSAHVSPFFPFC